ncbi:hypothetical protein K438DRAFT_312965 [Mycena galopus ATCC 62051]|nr:hypothetical protein K438DRAFT_312965 [Mycena galopus ATCC 62051]
MAINSPRPVRLPRGTHSRAARDGRRERAIARAKGGHGCKRTVRGVYEGSLMDDSLLPTSHSSVRPRTAHVEPTSDARLRPRRVGSSPSHRYAARPAPRSPSFSRAQRPRMSAIRIRCSRATCRAVRTSLLRRQERRPRRASISTGGSRFNSAVPDTGTTAAGRRTRAPQGIR